MNNIFNLFEKDPGEAAVKNLKMNLGITLIQTISAKKQTVGYWTKLLGIGRKKLADLMAGDFSKFKLEDIVKFSAIVGVTFDYAMKKRSKKQRALIIKIEPYKAQ